MSLLSCVVDWFAYSWVFFATLGLIFVYHTVIKTWSFFSHQNVPFARGLPVLGSMWNMLIGRESMADCIRSLYQRFPNDRFFGMYDMMGVPSYMIRDPELVKQISIRDFDHFVNHRMSISTEIEPLMGRAMFTSRDDTWRTLRSLISPAFTGSKMRLMLSLVGDVAHRFVGHLETELNGKGRVFDIMKLTQHYASDTIASAAFGLDVNSMADPDNEFLQMGINVSDFGGLKSFKMFGFLCFPAAMKFFRIRFFTEKQTEYFRHLVHSTIRYREEHGIVRHDMINLLIDARNGQLFHKEETGKGVDEDIGFATVQESQIGKKSAVDHVWEDDDLVAQSMLFLLAGFNAVGHACSMLTLELCNHPAIQQRLYEEIVAVQSASESKTISYEAMQKMKYLDMCVSELLRRWSIGSAQDRYVNKPYVLENTDGSKVQLNVGDGLWLPTYAIHLDEAYFKNPELFDPERFSDENKCDIDTSTYIPFGTGPRNCIGSRFALMEIKAYFVYLLQKFELVKCAKTMDPIVLLPGMQMMVQPKDGYWAELRPRRK